MSDAVSEDVEKKDWTIMVYMSGDNNLNQETINAIKGIKSTMQSKGGRSRIALLVYYDPSTTSFPTAYIDFTNDDGTGPFIRAPYGSGDSAETSDEESLYRFVRWCVTGVGDRRGHVAKNYALIMSGHGYGFQKDTFMRDDNPNYAMTPRRLVRKLERIKRYLLRQKLAVLGLDSCAMSTIEFATQVASVADTLVASQGLIPASGWSYRDLLDKIDEVAAAGRPLTTVEMSAAIATSFYDVQL